MAVRIVVAAFAAVAVPDAAHGGTILHPPGAARLDFVASPGEGNRVTVTSSAGAIVVADRGPASLQPLGDCRGDAGGDPQLVTCPAGGITALELRGGDLDDELTNATALGAQAYGESGHDVLRGGSGDDQLAGGLGDDRLSGSGGEDYVDGEGGVDVVDGGRGADVVAVRDGARDQPVSCGPGDDLAIVDRRDRAVRLGENRCERVDVARKRKPRRGWVYVHPHRCDASSDGVGLGLPAMHRLVPLRYSILLASGFRRQSAPTLDAADCPIGVTAPVGRGTTASADVSGGAVTVDQNLGHQVTTTLTVKPPTCTAGGRSAAAPADEPRLRLKTRGRRGRWHVRGEYSDGASVGTDWTTVEGCSSTTTIVRTGRVKVYDRIKRRTITVRAGDRYVAQRPAGR